MPVLPKYSRQSNKSFKVITACLALAIRRGHAEEAVYWAREFLEPDNYGRALLARLWTIAAEDIAYTSPGVLLELPISHKGTPNETQKQHLLRAVVAMARVPRKSRAYRHLVLLMLVQFLEHPENLPRMTHQQHKEALKDALTFRDRVRILIGAWVSYRLSTAEPTSAAIDVDHTRFDHRTCRRRFIRQLLDCITVHSKDPHALLVSEYIKRRIYVEWDAPIVPVLYVALAAVACGASMDHARNEHCEVPTDVKPCAIPDDALVYNTLEGLSQRHGVAHYFDRFLHTRLQGPDPFLEKTRVMYEHAAIHGRIPRVLLLRELIRLKARGECVPGLFDPRTPRGAHDRAEDLYEAIEQMRWFSVLRPLNFNASPDRIDDGSDDEEGISAADRLTLLQNDRRLKRKLSDPANVYPAPRKRARPSRQVPPKEKRKAATTQHTVKNCKVVTRGKAQSVHPGALPSCLPGYNLTLGTEHAEPTHRRFRESWVSFAVHEGNTVLSVGPLSRDGIRVALEANEWKRVLRGLEPLTVVARHGPWIRFQNLYPSGLMVQKHIGNADIIEPRAEEWEKVTDTATLYGLLLAILFRAAFQASTSEPRHFLASEGKVYTLNECLRVYRRPGHLMTKGFGPITKRNLRTLLFQRSDRVRKIMHEWAREGLDHARVVAEHIEKEAIF